MTPLRAIAVAVLAGVVDVTWAHYVMATASRNARKAALWAVGILACGAYNIDAYAESLWYVIPGAVGAAVGTYLTVRERHGS